MVEQLAALGLPAAALLIDPVTLNIEEELSVKLTRDGGFGNFDLLGILSLKILNQNDRFIKVQELFSRHPPSIIKDLYRDENILCLRNLVEPFPSGKGVILLKWRMQSEDESLVPLSINCRSSVSGYETYVNLKYEAPTFDLQNVVISIPLPALREAPKVQQVDGDWRYESRKSVLEWTIVLIDNSNRSGSMEFVIPAVDTLDLYPISVRFTSTTTFSNLKVVNVLPLEIGNTPEFSLTKMLSTDKYQVV